MIGSGPVGLAALLGLKNKSGAIQVFLSEENQNHKTQHHLFDIPTISSFSGRGGLGRFWHNVLDITYTQANYSSSSISHMLKYFWSINLLELEDDIKNLSTYTGLEIVPRVPLRPQSRKDLLQDPILMPAVNQLIPKSTCSQVVFEDNSRQDFDRVIVCSGVFGTSRLLKRSGLARERQTIGDHLIFMTPAGARMENPELKVTARRKNFISRNYYQNGPNKIMLRPSFTKKDKKSLIYNKSTVGTIFDIIKNLDFGTLMESTNLRYGYPTSGSTFKMVAQVSVADAYLKEKSGELQSNQKKINKIITSLEPHSIENKLRIFSGIHFYNVAKSNSLDIVSLPYEDTNIAIFSPALEVEMPSNHFTFSIMLSAFEYAQNMAN